MKKIFNILPVLCSLVLLGSCTVTESAGDGYGYMTLDISSVSSTCDLTTRTVPAGYDARSLHVEIADAQGTVLHSTDNLAEWEGRAFKLAPGTYSVSAHSAYWDGNDSGRNIPYYFGSTEVALGPNESVCARVVCTQANVKVSVEFDSSVEKAFKTARVEVSSAVSGISPQTFIMDFDDTLDPAFFPVGSLSAKLTVRNFEGSTYTMTSDFDNVQPRDHYILRYSTEASGNGSFTVTLDDGMTQYTYTFSVPVKSATTLNVTSVNEWSGFAWVAGNIPSAEVEIDPSLVKFQYRESGSSQWSEVAAEADGDAYRATVGGLRPATAYSVRMTYEKGTDSFASSERAFTTESAKALPNGGFEEWYTDSYPFACAEADYKAGNLFWDSSNKGSSLLNKVCVSGVKNPVHSGSKAAEVRSQKVLTTIAAGGLYVGEFVETNLSKQTAKVRFGRPWNGDRPSALHGWFQYSGGKMDVVNKAPAGVSLKKGETPDLWACYIALTTESYIFDNGDIEGTFLNLETDPRVIAYGILPDEVCSVDRSEWTEFTIPLIYRRTDIRPSAMILTMSSSKYGDYFSGYTGSKLYVDDLELIYGEPSL